jgi:hypothetical protein
MAESAPTLILLGVASACLLTATIALSIAVAELRRTLRGVNRMLPEARVACRELHRLLGRANRTTGHVEAVVHRACEAASAGLDRLLRFGGGAEHVLMKRIGNGAGAGPRRHHRRMESP